MRFLKDTVSGAREELQIWDLYTVALGTQDKSIIFYIRTLQT